MSQLSLGIKFRSRLYFIWSGDITSPKLTCALLNSGEANTPRVVKRLLRKTSSSGLREAHTSFKQVTVELNYERTRAKKWMIRFSLAWLIMFIICITSLFPNRSKGLHNFGIFVFVTSTFVVLAAVARFLFKRYQCTVPLMRLLPFRQLMLDGWIRTIRREIQLEEEDLSREKITTRFMYQEKSKRLSEKPVATGAKENVDKFYLELEHDAEALDPFLVRVLGKEGETPRSCTGREDIEVFSYFLKMDKEENFIVGPKYSRRSQRRDLLDAVSCDSISFTSAEEDREAPAASTAHSYIDPSPSSMSLYSARRLEEISIENYDTRFSITMDSGATTTSSVLPAKSGDNLNTPLLGSRTKNNISYFGTRQNSTS